MDSVLSGASKKVLEMARKKDKFIEDKGSGSGKMFSAAKLVAKAIYDGLQMQIGGGDDSGGGGGNNSMLLPELIIEDFDEEQVWAGVEMLNKAKFAEFSGKVGLRSSRLSILWC